MRNPDHAGNVADRSVPSALAARAATFYALWIVLIGVAPADLAAGVLAAGAAAWTSVLLSPPSPRRMRWGNALALVPYFLWKSLVAGVDVARRALAPRVRVNPGFVTYPTKLPRGAARNTFATFTSLMPGTVPCADEEDSLVYHCLDGGAAVADGLAADESRLCGTVGAAGDD
jgi:multicomponent Na+:H+ antiporter subunit E